MQHVVWDWNGTLFDDLTVVLAAVNRGVEPFGVPPVTLDHYRDHYTRPVKRFYDDLIGRELTRSEWEDLDNRFHVVLKIRIWNLGLCNFNIHKFQ